MSQMSEDQKLNKFADIGERIKMVNEKVFEC